MPFSPCRRIDPPRPHADALQSRRNPCRLFELAHLVFLRSENLLWWNIYTPQFHGICREPLTPLLGQEPDEVDIDGVGLSAFLTSTASTVLLTPIAISSAEALAVSPYPLAITVAIAASAAYLSPIATPLTLIMEPGSTGLRTS